MDGSRTKLADPASPTGTNASTSPKKKAASKSATLKREPKTPAKGSKKSAAAKVAQATAVEDDESMFVGTGDDSIQDGMESDHIDPTLEYL